MPNETQNFANHSRYVPGYHFVLFALLTLNFFFSLYQLRAFSLTALLQVVVAISLILIAWYARVFALTVQNRVIRLEERIRIARLCPELAVRAESLRIGQIVALRFASDEELPELLRKTLDGDLRDQRAIKSQIRNWRADYLRA